MPRRPRVLLADYPLHIVQHDINREPCFFTDECNRWGGATCSTLTVSTGRTSSLWEGRYKSSLVQAESHLLACLRHIDQPSRLARRKLSLNATTASADTGREKWKPWARWHFRSRKNSA